MIDKLDVHKQNLIRVDSMDAKPVSSARIAVIGAGTVGSAIAYALIHGSMYAEILLVDINREKRDAQVDDLMDAACAEGSTTFVRGSNLEDAGGCDIVVIVAGVKRKRGKFSY
jgi:L-lactate dehydrogenase